MSGFGRFLCFFLGWFFASFCFEEGVWAVALYFFVFVFGIGVGFLLLFFEEGVWAVSLWRVFGRLFFALFSDALFKRKRG